jgi:hypothetical protein
MRAKLIFDLDNPDDQMAHLRCVKSLDMALFIWEFIRNSRKKLEDREYSKDSDVFDGIEATFEEFYNLLKEHDINIDKLTY